MGEPISIITISYNSENCIEKTMRSVLAQTYRPLEYVLVDGASKDRTVEIIEKYLPEFEARGISVNFRSEPDRGISDAFNKGIQRATGSIIGIINSDDELVEDILPKVSEAFQEDTDVVCGDCLWVDAAHDLTYVRKSSMKLEKLKYEMVLMHPTCFVRKRAYEAWGMFDVTLKCVMDKDLMARFYRNGAKFSYLPLVLTRMTAGGISDTNVERVFEEGIEVAVRNGVPRWRAVLRRKSLTAAHKVVERLKRTPGLWKVLKR